jgi:hypothetical protein
MPSPARHPGPLWRNYVATFAGPDFRSDLPEPPARRPAHSQPSREATQLSIPEHR